MKGYPRWFPRLLGAASVVLGVTGLLLATTTLEMRAELELGWHAAGAVRTWGSACHALAGFMLMLFCGALWSIHMRAGWRRRQHRRSGLALALLLCALAGTAVGIYYSGDAELGNWFGYGHLAGGALLLVTLAWHWVRGRRLRRRYGTAKR
ncbi:hypothetical protein ACG0Z6_16380 [Roseateles sp. BYS180W]|uniref:DUF4405 domain-containing protein n=1 Tax=Roseateles rivi TaxID=3299028 RepID=A0ABW7FZS5_9BURK